MKKMSSSLRAKEDFIRMCREGQFIPGAKIPSEMEMAHRFGISRETWRNSLELLRREGIIYSKHGAGTYLLESQRKIDNDLSQLRSLSDTIRQAGIREGDSNITVDTLIPSEEIAKDLRCAPGETVVRIYRVRYSETHGIISTSLNYLPNHLADELEPEHLPPSIFQYFESKKGVYITRSSTSIVIPPQDDLLARDLRECAGAPVISLRQLHFDARGNPVMFSVDYLRCDLFSFSVTRIREK